MVTMTTDEGANPNPGPAGWGVLVRQNKQFICPWKHYEKSSNNVMELSAAIARLTFLPPDMIVWVSTDSQYVQKGINEWMPKWKRNGWTNSKKTWVAKRSLWLALAAAISRHKRVEFSWVKAHSGLLHKENSDTLAMRGVKGSTYCPTDKFDVLPPDTEREDDPSLPATEIITQTEEWDEDEHLPTFSSMAIGFGFGEEEAEEVRDRTLRHFLPEVAGNSSTSVSDDADPDPESDVQQWEDTLIIIIIHLLGVAPAGYLATPDSGPEGRL
jgi:ribonuclease HI